MTISNYSDSQRRRRWVKWAYLSRKEKLKNTIKDWPEFPLHTCTYYSMPMHYVLHIIYKHFKDI